MADIKRDKNGQIIPEEKGTVTYSTDKEALKTQQKADKPERQETKKALKKAQKEVKKQDEQQYADYIKYAYGMDLNSYNDLVASSGSGSNPPEMVNNISFEEYKAGKQNGDAKTETPVKTFTPKVTLPQPKAETPSVTPSQPVEQPKKDLSAEQKDLLKEGAKTAKDDRPIDTQDVKELLSKFKEGFNEVEDSYSEGLPSSIWMAWKNGSFGPKDTKDSKAVRNYLLLDTLFTGISNAGKAIKGQTEEEDMWSKNVKKNFDEANTRRNTKFSEKMKSEINFVNNGTDFSQKLDNDINKMFTDSVMGLYAKKTNNLEDQLGMLYIYERMGNEWSKLPKEQQWALIGAQQAFRNGDTTTGQQYLNLFSPEEVSKLQLETLQAELTNRNLTNEWLPLLNQANANATNASAYATTQAGNLTGKNVQWFDTNQTVNNVTNAIGAVGSLIPGK